MMDNIYTLRALCIEYNKENHSTLNHIYAILVTAHIGIKGNKEAAKPTKGQQKETISRVT